MGVVDFFKNLGKKNVGGGSSDEYTPTFNRGAAAAGNVVIQTKQIVVGGATAVGNTVADGYHNLASKGFFALHSSNTWLFLILCFVVNFWHLQRGFASFPADPMLVMYVLLAGLAAFVFYRDRDDPFPMKRFGEFLVISFIAYIVPFLIGYANARTDLDPRLLRIAAIFAPIWCFYIFSNPGDKFTRVMAMVFLIGWIAYLMLGVIMPTLADQNQVQAVLMNPQEMWETVIAAGRTIISPINSIRESPGIVWNDTREFFKGQIAAATDPQYTGTVDQTEGQPIGVYITDAKPLYQQFDTATDDVLVTATMKARTFSDSITIANNCSIKYTDNTLTATEQTRTGTTYPPVINVDYTGTFQDKFDLECTIPKEKLSDIKGKFVTGTVHFNSTFNFDTLGYAVYTFMDRDLMSAFRLENTDPASVLGVARVLEPKYTPGPLMLGMPSDSMPIAYENASQNLPAFGVTLTNAWHGKGGVDGFKHIEFYIPEPFYFKSSTSSQALFLPPETVECSGGVSGKVTIKHDRRRLGNERYLRYVVQNVDTLQMEKGQNYITIRCPIAVNANSQYNVLGSSGAGKYTFFVNASYMYSLESRAAVQLRGEGTSSTTGPVEINCISDTVQCPAGESECTCRARGSDGNMYNCEFLPGHQNEKTCTVTT